VRVERPQKRGGAWGAIQERGGNLTGEKPGVESRSAAARGSGTAEFRELPEGSPRGELRSVKKFWREEKQHA